jgi:N-acetylglucosamine kinase-like BadF-type ATPase
MFLGVDGGGTKTAFVLIDADGGIRASHVTGSVSHLTQGIDGATTLLADGIRALLARAVTAATQLDFAFFGLSSYGEDSAITARLDAMPAALLDRRRFRCGNDMLSSWAGSLACADGISVIAGTGSMAYGEHQGRSARAGGWGELIGDEGSAYWIAREGMNLFSRMSDGRAPRGPLHSLVRERLGLDSDLDLCARVYGGEASGRGAFAQFARLVHEAAERSDSGARTIFLRAAAELVDAVRAVRRALEVPDARVLPVSYSGGAFAGSPWLVDAFKLALTAEPTPYECRTPLFPPVVGAALYAARLAGTPLAGAALARLSEQCAGAALPG